MASAMILADDFVRVGGDGALPEQCFGNQRKAWPGVLISQTIAAVALSIPRLRSSRVHAGSKPTSNLSVNVGRPVR